MKTLAVHLHIFYKEQLPKIIKYLKNLEGVDYDLFVTMSDDDEEIKAQILVEHSQAKFFIVENRGYDIGPFIEFLHRIELNDYKYVLKVHTKGTKSNNYTHLNGNRLDNALWGRILWDSMLATKEQLSSNLKEFEKDEKLGMLGSAYCLTNSPVDYEKLLDGINENLAKMGFNAVKECQFVAGAMFMCRASLLEPLKCFKLSDFDLTDGKIKEGALAHIIERLMSVIVELQNYKIRGIKHKTDKLVKVYDSYSLMFFITSVGRFFFQKKITRSGKMLIKICKIPVYSKQMEI